MHLDKILNLFDNRCMHQEKVQIPADRSPNAPPPPQDLLMACSPSDTQLSLPQNVRQFIFAQCFICVNRKLGTCNLFEFLGVENKESGKNIGPILQFFPQAWIYVDFVCEMGSSVCERIFYSIKSEDILTGPFSCRLNLNFLRQGEGSIAYCWYHIFMGLKTNQDNPMITL